MFRATLTFFLHGPMVIYLSFHILTLNFSGGVTCVKKKLWYNLYRAKFWNLKYAIQSVLMNVYQDTEHLYHFRKVFFYACFPSLLPPFLQQPLIWFLLLKVSFTYLRFHTNWIIQNVLLFVWFLSFSIIFLRLIYVVT